MNKQAAPREPGSLEQRINEAYDALPRSERLVAHRIAEFPGDLLFQTATDLAERTRVSKATISRLVRRLGYRDYRELQREVRDAQNAGEPIYLNVSLAQPASKGEHIEAHLERDLMTLRQTFEGLRAPDLNEIAERTLASRRVWVMGFRNSYFFASYMRRQISQARPDVYLVPVPGQNPAEELAQVSTEDMVIAIGLRRRPPQLRSHMARLHERGIPIAYITDRSAVITKRFANWCITCPTQGMSLFDSYVGVVSVLNYLCTEIVALAGEAGRARLVQIEHLMDAASEIDKET